VSDTGLPDASAAATDDANYALEIRAICAKYAERVKRET
jgi:hypothetical protein